MDERWEFDYKDFYVEDVFLVGLSCILIFN